MTDQNDIAFAQMAAHPLSVMFCVPSKSGTPDMAFHIAYTETYGLLKDSGIPFMFNTLRGDAFVDKARNRGATQFINNTRANNLFFLDDDVGNWPSQKILEFLQRPEPVVCGLYPLKTDDAGHLKWPVNLTEKDGHYIEQRGYLQANWGPTGFMRIKRWVMMELSARSDVFPEQVDLFGGIEWQYDIFAAGSFKAKINPPPIWTDPFGRQHEMRDWRGEDIHFCDRVRMELGAEIWVDPSIPLTHQGGKTWKGVYGVSCAEEIAAKMPKSRMAVDRLLGAAA
jgi:hypothetical protein